MYVRTGRYRGGGIMQMEYNLANHVKNLPDAYKKTNDSNNYKILEMERLAGEYLMERLQAIDNILDVNNATGKTLDLYGERVGQARGLADDEKYLLMIKAKIMRNLSNGSYTSIVDAICATFDCPPEEVYIKESENKPCTVESVELPLERIVEAGLTASQAIQIIESLLPTGITLEFQFYEGTFEFGETEDEYDETKGFAISEEDQSIGGYLGYVSGDKNEEILPI